MTTTIGVFAVSLASADFTLTATTSSYGGGSFKYSPRPGTDYQGTATLLPITHLASGSTQAVTAANLINSKYPPQSPYSAATAGTGTFGTMNISTYGL